MNALTLHERTVLDYYRKSESRIGYQVLLNGIRHFGWYPGDGSASRWRFGEAQRRMELLLGRRLDASSGSLVLDAGCGEGHVARTLVEEYGVHVTGVDLVPESIDIAVEMAQRSQQADRLKFSVGSYQDLPFEASTFDHVYTMETFVHSPDPVGGMEEFYRVVRPGGTVVMFEYSSTPKERLEPDSFAALKRVCELAAMPGWIELTHGRLEELARRVGFSVVSAENITGNMLPMLRAFSVLARGPWLVLGLAGQQQRAVNVMSAVEMYKHLDAWAYNIYVLRRPSGL